MSGGRLWGTELVCSCGFRKKVSNMAPSRGGLTHAQTAYREHLADEKSGSNPASSPLP